VDKTAPAAARLLFKQPQRRGGQIWTAVCAHLLVAIAQREQALPGSLHRTLQIISTSPFEKTPLRQLVMEHNTRNAPLDAPIQLEFNEL
jgi:hypothetical protein